MPDLPVEVRTYAALEMHPLPLDVYQLRVLLSTQQRHVAPGCHLFRNAGAIHLGLWAEVRELLQRRNHIGLDHARPPSASLDQDLFKALSAHGLIGSQALVGVLGNLQKSEAVRTARCTCVRATNESW